MHFSLLSLAGWGGICAFHDPSLSAAYLATCSRSSNCSASPRGTNGAAQNDPPATHPGHKTDTESEQNGWLEKRARLGWPEQGMGGDKPGSCGGCRCRGGPCAAMVAFDRSSIPFPKAPVCCLMRFPSSADGWGTQRGRSEQNPFLRCFWRRDGFCIYPSSPTAGGH